MTSFGGRQLLDLLFQLLLLVRNLSCPEVVFAQKSIPDLELVLQLLHLVS